jgi:hypothetical protein
MKILLQQDKEKLTTNTFVSLTLLWPYDPVLV